MGTGREEAIKYRWVNMLWWLLRELEEGNMQRPDYGEGKGQGRAEKEQKKGGDSQGQEKEAGGPAAVKPYEIGLGLVEVTDSP